MTPATALLREAYALKKRIYGRKKFVDPPPSLVLELCVENFPGKRGILAFGGARNVPKK